MKKLWLPFLFLTIITLLFTACKKNLAIENYTETVNPVIPDFTTPVNAAVNGFITDENGNAVEAATVKGGTVTVTTDKYGYFKISAAAFAKSAGFVQVSKAGYFTGYRTFLPVEGKEIFIRLQLIPKTIAGNIESGTGGTVTTTDGAKITLPANGVVIASSNAAYNGVVNVAVHWLNPAEMPTINLTMPGDLTGVDSAGYLNVLVTYGMLAVELSSNSGELLQIAPGKKAALSFPIPASLQTAAPASIPLWYFDESKGVWRQEGRALKNGSNYGGEVSHFSFWNCDIGYSPVSFTAQIVDSTLRPLANTEISITGSQFSSYNHGYTDTSGIIYGMVPANANLTLKVVTGCTTTAYEKSFTSAYADIDLGTIRNQNNYYYLITGTAIGCTNSPVTNGTAFIYLNNRYFITTLQNGIFSLLTLECPSSPAKIVVIDSNNNTQSLVQFVTLNQGVNNVGTISTCSMSSEQYMIISVDGASALTFTPTSVGGSYTYYSLADTSTHINYVFTNISGSGILDMKLAGFDVPGNHLLWHNGQAFTSITINNTGSYGQPTPFTTTISEYGTFGEFISGEFSAVFHMLDNHYEDHTINCSFRVKRTY